MTNPTRTLLIIVGILILIAMIIGGSYNEMLKSRVTVTTQQSNIDAVLNK